jgi:hypothetical protein
MMMPNAPRARFFPSPPFRGEREGPSARRWKGEVGLGGRSGIPHLIPILSAPQWTKADGEGVYAQLGGTAR